jgi:polyphosphate kinase
MQRNLDRRVELIAPIADPKLRKHLKEEVLDIYLRDNLKARRLQPDGTYTRVVKVDGEEPTESQKHLSNYYASLQS